MCIIVQAVTLTLRVYNCWGWGGGKFMCHSAVRRQCCTICDCSQNGNVDILQCQFLIKKMGIS